MSKDYDGIVELDSPKEIDSLKEMIFNSKRKRLAMIDGFIDKMKKELDKRELKDVPTPVLARMLASFADLAKKEQPVIEVKYGKWDDDMQTDITL